MSLFEAKPTPILNALKTANMVRLRQVQLQSPPNVLLRLFPREALARVKIQLQVLKQISQMKSNYLPIHANNGTFWKLPAVA